MFAWLQKWFGRARVRTPDAGNRAGDATRTEPASNWDARLYMAAHHHFYRSLIQIQPPASEPGAEIRAPESQTGIDLEGLDTRLGAVAEAAAEELNEIEQIFSHLPRQPTMLPRLGLLIRDPGADTSDMVALINEDPGFVARLLDMANSPFFRMTRQPLADLHTAVVHLGTEGLQALVNQCVFQPILSPRASRIKGLSDRLYAHALTCADMGQDCARREGYPPNLVHLFGLLQGLGDITLLTYLTRAFRLDEDDLGRVFRSLAPKYALDISVATVEQWQMGDELIEALRAMRNPGDKMEGFSRFCARIRAASMLGALHKAGAIRRHNLERHAKTLGFEQEVFNQVH